MKPSERDLRIMPIHENNRLDKFVYKEVLHAGKERTFKFLVLNYSEQEIYQMGMHFIHINS
jgi:hypothetical protein